MSATVGAILGTAVGDALGLPYENLSKRRGRRLFGLPDRHHFLFGRGMVSDDTEHTCMVAQAMIAGGDDVDAFRGNFAWRLRLWLLALPAGIGLATLKSILKLWLGFPASRSGVFSAGNGPAMRAAIFGAAVDDLDLLRQFVRASTRITHTDPKAEFGALAVALAARHARTAVTTDGAEFLATLRTALPESASEFLALAERAVASAASGESTENFAAGMGLKRGVSGYVYHTVPVVLQAWLRHSADYRGAVSAVICCGGDTDSTVAIVGGILGAGLGKSGIPADWLARIWEWPRTCTWMERLGERLAVVRATRKPDIPPRLPMPGLLVRNGFFIAVVFAHVFRRLLPPY
jgi:ADP-ribosylglycohydrolase